MSRRADRLTDVLDSNTCDNPSSDVHLIDGAGEGRGDGSHADEEASHHDHWTVTKAVAQQCGQGG